MILQPGDIALDYSFSRPSVPAMVAAGVRLVVRYISSNRGNPKNLSLAERDAILGGGLALLLVWEQSAADPAQGALTGAKHGSAAASYAHDLGYPTDIPIIVAVDFDVQPAQMAAVLHYLEAFKQASGWRQGVYGKDAMVTAAHDAGVSELGWQTRAWSKGRRSPHADCLQEIGFVHPGLDRLGSVDDNTVLRPFAAWSTGSAPPEPDPQPIGGGRPMWHVIDKLTGKFWQIGLDYKGVHYARPFDEIPDPEYWNDLSEISGVVEGPLKPVDHDWLQNIYDKRGKPDLPPASTPPPSTIAPHAHYMPPTGAVVDS